MGWFISRTQGRVSLPRPQDLEYYSYFQVNRPRGAQGFAMDLTNHRGTENTEKSGRERFFICRSLKSLLHKSQLCLI
ncbi:hypothetical protein BDGGKGIB_03561 [Nodularia sphaerocarpa UHCC 0038]|nr:hypothetical protein BDGGKGIB_03561 [Nodularia sphaerocarpa UHCC 0038]